MFYEYIIPRKPAKYTPFENKFKKGLKIDWQNSHNSYIIVLANFVGKALKMQEKQEWKGEKNYGETIRK